jgi:hypothetical protein
MNENEHSNPSNKLFCDDAALVTQLVIQGLGCLTCVATGHIDYGQSNYSYTSFHLLILNLYYDIKRQIRKCFNIVRTYKKALSFHFLSLNGTKVLIFGSGLDSLLPQSCLLTLYAIYVVSLSIPVSEGPHIMYGFLHCFIFDLM